MTLRYAVRLYNCVIKDGAVHKILNISIFTNTDPPILKAREILTEVGSAGPRILDPGVYSAVLCTVQVYSVYREVYSCTVTLDPVNERLTAGK